MIDRNNDMAAVRSASSKAEAKARAEYEKFNKTQPVESDFDRVVKAVAEKKRGGK